MSDHTKNTKKVKNIQSLVRVNIMAMDAYSSARSLYTSGIFFDANENPYNIFDSQAGGIEVNRYPDGKNAELRKNLGLLYGLPSAKVAVGNGSDELIDLLIRIFCRPGLDEIIICPPTFGMYRVSANMNDVSVCEIPLKNYSLDIEGIHTAITANTKILFICNPNNPTGSTTARAEIIELVEKLNLIVVVDEAYGDFMDDESLISSIDQHANLIVLRTLSKAFALAGARLGIVMASEFITSLVQKVKFPYNINSLSTTIILNALLEKNKVAESIVTLKIMRDEMEEVLRTYTEILEIIPSQANFLCVRFADSQIVFEALVKNNIITRRVAPQYGMQNILRISIGTFEQNKLLLDTLEKTLTRIKA